MALSVVTEGPHRAAQLNAAAARARGDLLLFLHADPACRRTLTAHWAGTDAAGGNFALRFDGGDRFARVLTRAYAFQRRFGFYYGDSTIWLRPATFAALGGYRDLPIMDDYDLVRRLERDFQTGVPAGAGAHLAAPLAGDRGAAHARHLVGDPAAVRGGVPAQRLARLYKRVR